MSFLQAVCGGERRILRRSGQITAATDQSQWGSMTLGWAVSFRTTTRIIMRCCGIGNVATLSELWLLNISLTVSWCRAPS